MRYLKPFNLIKEDIMWRGDIMKINKILNFIDKMNLSKDPVEISKDHINKIFNTLDDYKIGYEVFNENRLDKKTLTIVFNIAKKFDKLSFNFHEYDPAEVRYLIRINRYEYYWGEDEDIFLVQWVGKLFAHPDHFENYYKK